MATGRIIRPRTQEGWDLLVPGRKPRDFIIDTANSVFDGLQCFYDFSNPIGNIVPSDWGQLQETGTPALRETIIGTSKNANSTDCIYVNAGIDVENVFTMEFYLIPRVIATASAAGYSSYSAGLTSSTQSLTLYADGAKWKFLAYAPSAVTLTSDSGCVVNKPSLVHIVADNITIRLYIDGVLEDSKSANTYFSSYGSTPHLLFGRSRLGNGTEADWLHYAYWSRDLTSAEIARRATSLYEPANDTPFLYSITGGATVTLSNPLASANGQNGWSGSCDVTYA